MYEISFLPRLYNPLKENAYELSMRKVASKLDIVLVPLQEENCCGFFVEPIDHMSAVVMAARDLALFDAANLDAVTPCPACYGQLTRVRDELLTDKKLAEEVNTILKGSNRKFTGAHKENIS
jgi:heterodisulfide reductase subunit B